MITSNRASRLRAKMRAGELTPTETIELEEYERSKRPVGRPAGVKSSSGVETPSPEVSSPPSGSTESPPHSQFDGEPVSIEVPSDDPPKVEPPKDRPSVDVPPDGSGEMAIAISAGYMAVMGHYNELLRERGKLALPPPVLGMMGAAMLRVAKRLVPDMSIDSEWGDYIVVGAGTLFVAAQVMNLDEPESAHESTKPIIDVQASSPPSPSASGDPVFDVSAVVE